jgi:hypothetical protein
MGQYHKLYNLDKRETVHPHKIDNGLKLYEQINHVCSTSTALFALVANSNARGSGDFPKHPLIGSWAGDRILVQGDYAEPNDKAYTDPDTLESFTDISDQVADMLQTIEARY